MGDSGRGRWNLAAGSSKCRSEGIFGYDCKTITISQSHRLLLFIFRKIGRFRQAEEPHIPPSITFLVSAKKLHPHWHISIKRVVKMNRPSRTDEPQKGDGYNQSPNDLSNDLTTNEDLNGISNSRVQRSGEPLSIQSGGQNALLDEVSNLQDTAGIPTVRIKDGVPAESLVVEQQAQGGPHEFGPGPQLSAASHGGDDAGNGRGRVTSALHRTKNAIITFSKFIGPGFMVAVSYSTCVFHGPSIP